MMLIDYLLVSFISEDVDGISHYLFSDDFLAEFCVLESSMRGFQNVYTDGKIFFHYENKGKKSVVLFEIKSKGCRFLETSEKHSWILFLQTLSEVMLNLPIERLAIKRLDVAIDRFDDVGLTTKRAKNYLRRQLISSRFRTMRIIEEYRINSGCISGDSVYFGDRSSDLFFLIYDKQLESDTQKTWYRTELRLRNAWGTKAVNELVSSPDNFPKFISSVLVKNLQFRTSSNNRKEIRRRPLAKWYETYLAYVGNLSLLKR